MNKLYVLLLFLGSIGLLVAPPVKKVEAAAEKKELTEHEKQDQEYYRYLAEIAGELEKDEEFAKVMANVSEDNRPDTDKFARALKKVKLEVRNNLDAIKRREVERTLELIRLQKKHVLADTNGDAGHRVKSWHPAHDDTLLNTDTFEVEDIKKLLKKHHDMMDETDRRRKDDFKDYEMEKEHKRRAQMKNMTAEERTQEDIKHKEGIQNRQKHEPMHEPGHKKELEEVWEKEDGLDPDSYDPKTFFALHDKDGNGYLDNFELETLFLTDLDKTYNESDPDVDPKERNEEMERMREHVMKEWDKNSDGMVSLEEFLAESEDEKFDEDEEWKPLTDDEQYTEEELAEFEKEEYEDDEGDYEDYDHEGLPPVRHGDAAPANHKEATPL